MIDIDASFQEVRRGLGEQFSLKIWWLLTTAAQVDGTSLMFLDVYLMFFFVSFLSHAES